VASDPADIGNLESCEGILYIGAHKTLAAGDFWNGLIDEMRIYDRALGDAEIKALAQYPYIISSFPELNGNGLSAGPSLTADELTIVYETNRTTPDYTGYWKFSEGTGSVTQDSSPNGRTGQIYDSAAWTTGYVDNCLTFDGTNDYVEVTGYQGIGGTNPRSMSCWIRTTKASAEIISWGTANVTGQRWILRTDDIENSEAQLRLEVNGGRIIGTANIIDDQWHHVAATWENDGTPTILDAKLYVDGICETISSSTDYPVNTGSTQNVQIGICREEGNSRYFKGLIDEVRIYDRALSEAEIKALAQYPLNSTLWTASRASTSDAFTNIRPLDELNSAFKQTQPTLSANGLTIYFSSNRQNGQTWNIYKATRPTLDAPFTVEGILPAANNLSKDGSPFVSEDGQLIYYYKETSTQKGLWVSQWQQSDKPCEPK
jgi:hypothetical protein